MNYPAPQGRVRLPNLTPKLKGDTWVLQFSFKGVQKYLSFGIGKIGETAATATGQRILGDLQTGNFDSSLNKYRSTTVQTSVPVEPKTKALSILELWDKWVGSLQLSERTLSGHYAYTRKWLIKYSPDTSSATWLTQIECSATVWNQRRSMLVSCFEWVVRKGLVSVNPYLELKSRKELKDRSKRKPFTQLETEKIMSGFEHSNDYYHYFDFVKFILTTGCRPSEAIGLTRDCIDLNTRQLTLKQSGSRDDTGRSNGSKRVLKERKTGNQTTFSIPDSLFQMLEKRVQNLDSNDLVFPSPNGIMIDDRMFSRRAWKTVLESAGVEYRPPYTTRHTVASKLIESGVPITGVAYLLGHSDTTMVSRHYGHMINRPTLPDL